MITIEQIKEEIQARLNEAAENLPFEFLIHANAGAYNAEIDRGQREHPKPLINGVLLSLPSSVVPILSVKSYTASQLLTFLVPVNPDNVNESLNPVMNAIQAFVENQSGFVGNVTDESGISFAYVFAPQLPQAGQLNNDLGFIYVPVTVSLTWQFIAGGMISNGIAVKIDGERVVLLEGGFVRTRVAETDNKENSAELQSTVGQQGFTVKVVLPYITTKDNDKEYSLSAKLIRDMLVGGLNEVYNVEYEDGIIKTSGNNPSWQMVATDISTNLSAGTVVSVSATFVIASDIYKE